MDEREGVAYELAMARAQRRHAARPKTPSSSLCARPIAVMGEHCRMRCDDGGHTEGGGLVAHGVAQCLKGRGDRGMAGNLHKRMQIPGRPKPGVAVAVHVVGERGERQPVQPRQRFAVRRMCFT